ncbi:MAG: ABC transporter ATP-binding protein [Myxococcales bacterium]|nr:MAG: ABC transporter ATP-binding protein [Myxococcales bacterium]
MTRAVLNFEHVAVRYHENRPPALNDVSFAIHPGERVALFGLNGSGKTTLFLAAVGLVPYEGIITVGGQVLGKKSLAEVRSKIGFLFNVPEDQLLFPRVVDDVAFTLIRKGAPAPEARQKALEALASLGADSLAERPPHELSHGERLRTALAGILVGNPLLLLLDEPSAGLDPPAKKRLARQLGDCPSAMLVATHDISFARLSCQRCIMLEHGRIVLEGQSFDEVETRWDLYGR